MKANQIPTKINSVSSYIEAIFNLRKAKIAEFSAASYWFFRGQKNSLWSMRPNVFRNDALSLEYEAIESALRQRPYDFRECRSDFEIPTKLQHYGLGTRLLDVTLNPLVALYFASAPHEDIVQGKDGRGKSVPRDGKVVYRYGYGHKLTELNVRVGCALPFIEFEEDFTIKHLCEVLLKKGIITSDEYTFFEADDYKEFVHAIQSNNFVVSSYSNDRLTRQSGAFVIPTAIKIILNVIDMGNSLVRKTYCNLDDEFEEKFFIIPHDKKNAIRDELDFLNINEATLFPELEHQLLYLQNRKIPQSGTVEAYEKFVYTERPLTGLDTEGLSETDMHEPNPDVKKIVNIYFKQTPDVAEAICKVIETDISSVDWWIKDTIISQINRDITRALQSHKSMTESKAIANNIVELLKNPGSEYQKSTIRE